MDKTTFTIVLIAGLFSKRPCLVVENILIKIKMDWNTAQAYCRTNYKDLYTITSGDEMDQVTKIRGPDFTWIGLYRDPNHPTKFLWSDGATSTFRAWGAGQPNDLGGIQDCVRIEDISWNDYDCNDQNYVFCETEMREMVVVETPMEWEEALAYCRSHYKDLVSLGSQTELEVALQKAEVVQGTHFWTGLRFLDDSWLWVDGEQLTDGSWFAETLPQCPAWGLRCGGLSTTSSSQEVWSCDERLSFICYAE